jgi:hypothetical protein
MMPKGHGIERVQKNKAQIFSVLLIEDITPRKEVEDALQK